MASNYDSEYIQHSVQPGDSFWGLVEEYDTTAEDILADNPNLDPNNLQVGQMVLIQPWRRRRPYYRPYRPYYRPYYPPYYPYYPYPYRRY